MPGVDATVAPDAIRIEDEVWQEAFARREPGQARTRRRLRAVDGGGTSSSLEPHTAPAEKVERFGTRGWLAAAPDSPAVPAANPAARTSADAAANADADSGIAPSSAPLTTTAAAPTRRIVTIRGRGAERHLPWPDASRARPQRRVYERAGFRPDRPAMWAVLLGFLLVLVAAVSAH